MSNAFLNKTELLRSPTLHVVISLHLNKDTVRFMCLYIEGTLIEQSCAKKVGVVTFTGTLLLLGIYLLQFTLCAY